MVTAKVVYDRSDLGMEQIEVGTHSIQFGGADGDGYCYKHQSFDCVLTDEEKLALQSPEYSDEFYKIHNDGSR